MDDTMISLTDVTLTLTGPERAVPILYKVDLAVQKGEAVSIVGPSGSGKTSLLMLMAGVQQTTSGTVRIAGEDITHYSEDRLAAFRRGRVGVVFQNFQLIPTMSALENVRIALEFAGAADAETRAREALGQVGLGDRLGHYPDQLSGGEQQRVALARAFAPRPALLLADEPTGNLDSETGEQIMALLFGLCAEYAATLVLITHDTQLAARTQRQYAMKDGHLHAN